ncbi:MAG: serine protease [Microcystaceae cyanobacterium]
MKGRILEISCLIGLLVVHQSLATEEPLHYESDFPTPVLSPTLPASSELEDAIYQKAAAVTVKVMSGSTGGSGVLIRQQGSTYWVLTNHHVLIFGQSQQNYQIITPDGQIYPAKVIIDDQNEQDLAILAFNSPLSYKIATLSPPDAMTQGEEVFAAGFPSEMEIGNRGHSLHLSQGTIGLFSTQPFGGGYQIGYTSRVRKGMSGGPLFNRQGEIIGLNGIHKYPLWGNPYVFVDGSRANSAQKQQMSQYSWAIPVAILQQWLRDHNKL